MQATTTFGRRGAQPAPTFVKPAAALAPPQADPILQAPGTQARATVFPVVTLGILAALVVIYALEMAVSAAGGHPGRVSHSALVKLGGLSRELALGRGQVWRVLTVSLLHVSLAHLIGNAVALVLVGLLLEPIVGRGWFALIYVIGGIGGAIGSLALNSPQILSVGASGAIMCLLSCSLVLSVHAASFERRRRMQILSLRVMIPALLPLSGTHGHVDYSGHIGGALTGIVLGFLLQIIWSEEEPRPPQGLLVGCLAGAGAAAGALALALATVCPATAFTETAGLIPIDDAPESTADWAAQASQLSDRYPADPRPHLFKALGFMKAHDDASAESEFLTALRSPLLNAPELPSGIGAAIRSGLIGVYLQEGRVDDAKTTAAPLCAAPASAPPQVMTLLRKAKVCDPV